MTSSLSPNSFPSPPISPISPLAFSATMSNIPSSQTARPLPAVSVELPPDMTLPSIRNRRGSVSAECDRIPSYTPVVIAKTPEQVERIRESIRTNILFTSLDETQQKEIIDAMVEMNVPPGMDIIREGESGDYYYIIESGEFDVYKYIRNPEQSASQQMHTPLQSSLNGAASNLPQEKVHEYLNKGSFGELALMYKCPRAATVRARTNGVLWRVDRQTFRHFVVDSQQKDGVSSPKN